MEPSLIGLKRTESSRKKQTMAASFDASWLSAPQPNFPPMPGAPNEDQCLIPILTAQPVSELLRMTGFPAGEYLQR